MNSSMAQMSRQHEGNSVSRPRPESDDAIALSRLQENNEAALSSFQQSFSSNSDASQNESDVVSPDDTLSRREARHLEQQRRQGHEGSSSEGGKEAAAAGTKVLSNLFSSPPRRGRRFKGVRHRKWGKFVCEIRDAIGKRIWLGSYDSDEQAARVYDAAARILQGDCAYLNFPNQQGDLGDSDPVQLPRSTLQQLFKHRSNTAHRLRAGSLASSQSLSPSSTSNHPGSFLPQETLLQLQGTPSSPSQPKTPSPMPPFFHSRSCPADPMATSSQPLAAGNPCAASRSLPETQTLPDPAASSCPEGDQSGPPPCVPTCQLALAPNLDQNEHCHPQGLQMTVGTCCLEVLHCGAIVPGQGSSPGVHASKAASQGQAQLPQAAPASAAPAAAAGRRADVLAQAKSAQASQLLRLPAGCCKIGNRAPVPGASARVEAQASPVAPLQVASAAKHDDLGMTLEVKQEPGGLLGPMSSDSGPDVSHPPPQVKTCFKRRHGETLAEAAAAHSKAPDPVPKLDHSVSAPLGPEALSGSIKESTPPMQLPATESLDNSASRSWKFQRLPCVLTSGGLAKGAPALDEGQGTWGTWYLWNHGDFGSVELVASPE